MPLQDAINFIKDVGRDRSMRKSLYAFQPTEILPELAKKGYEFSFDDFEESVNMLHVQCQSEEQANKLFEVVWWFKMLSQ